MSARSVRTVLVAAAVLVLGAGLARAQTPFAATNIGPSLLSSCSTCSDAV